MFGHPDETTNQQDNKDVVTPGNAIMADDPSVNDVSTNSTKDGYIMTDTNSANDNTVSSAPVLTTPSSTNMATGETPAPTPSAPSPTQATDPDTDQLLTIKQQALQQLSPLVSHLDQTPEEEFRTTMMMIQGSDNHELIQQAYDAAQKISDEKTRAQALLDVVNEINYFTQHKAQEK